MKCQAKTNQCRNEEATAFIWEKKTKKNKKVCQRCFEKIKQENGNPKRYRGWLDLLVKRHNE